jgi:hypothetical protein
MILASAMAHADGAFPDSFAMFAPPDLSSTLRLATNFGLVFSNDNAQTWHYVCETAVISFASLYAEGPDDSLYAVSALGLVSSRDGGCSWQVAQGSLALSDVSDVFPDPSDAMHVLAIAQVVGDAGTAGNTALYESHDGGLTFGPALYTPPDQRTLSGVEIAKSDPKTIYLTMYDPGPHPFLARSSDGGASFSVIDLGGNDLPRLIAVDRQSSQRLFLRLQGTAGEALGISSDGGTTVQKPLTVPGKLSAFLLRTSGTILVGGLSGTTGASWRSIDGGMTFSNWPIDIHLRGLAERAGRLFLVGDDKIDPAALFQSDDENTLTPVMRFRDIAGPAECGRVPAVCADPWMQLQPLINPNYDAGVSDGPVPAVPPRGCGLTLSGGGFGVLPLLFVVVVALLLRNPRKAYTARAK